MYLEYGTYFPHRSGAEAAYLEKAFPQPRYFLPATFAVQSVLLSFSSSNAIVMAQYLLAAGGGEQSTWRVRGLAVGSFTVVIVLCCLNTKFSLHVSNLMGIVKLVTLAFVGITGLIVLGGHTKVPDPKTNFRDSFAQSSSNGNGLCNALVKVNFAYAGFENAFNLMNEIKVGALDSQFYKFTLTPCLESCSNHETINSYSFRARVHSLYPSKCGLLFSCS